MLIFSCISYQKPKICMNFKKHYIENYSREVPFCEHCVNGSLFWHQCSLEMMTFHVSININVKKRRKNLECLSNAEMTGVCVCVCVCVCNWFSMNGSASCRASETAQVNLSMSWYLFSEHGNLLVQKSIRQALRSWRVSVLSDGVADPCEQTLGYAQSPH